VPQSKFHGDILLIKAESGGAREEDVGWDYGLSEVKKEALFRETLVYIKLKTLFSLV